ncbi:FHA domain-containing protein [Streptomyces sp. NPDC059176]|uniref:FHA domain-containing protein n=1 Tax=unclassified Streptomyces TaxID=2593676 RepID=UPI00369D6F78
MQIRLTVLAPRSGPSVPAAGPAPTRASDVLVTAPAGTALAAVASGLAAAAAGPEASSATVVLYAGRERLDAQRCALGEPPLVDGAVLSLNAPGEDEAADESGGQTQLHVIAGPDAGGVHLLHGGRIRVGRSAEADVPLDDPDVSRLHCEVTVAADGRVTVADLGSTNGTSLGGAEVGSRPVRLTPGALLRIGESTLRLASPRVSAGPATAPDGEGHIRVRRTASDDDGATARGDADHTRPHAAEGSDTRLSGHEGGRPGSRRPSWAQGMGTEVMVVQDGRPAGPSIPGAPSRSRSVDGTRDEPHGAADALWIATGAGEAAGGTGTARTVDPGTGTGGDGPAAGAGERTDGSDDPDRYEPATGGRGGRGSDVTHVGTAFDPPAPAAGDGQAPGKSARPRGEGGSRRRGIGAWARRLTGAREDGPEPAADEPPLPSATVPAVETWPDPAAVLLTALGPGPRLWERGPGHPESMVVRLGTVDRAGSIAVPVTVGLREAGSLGLAGPRARLMGLARSVVAQLAALHSPADLEIVLISTDRARSLEERRQEWHWLGWLPHLRPSHGQDCRLLLAYERDQATARTAELTRRLDEGPLGPGWPSAEPRAVEEAAARYDGTRTLVLLDGDPGSAALRESTARLAAAGTAAGIHVVCLAETPAASPRSPVAATYEEACAASLAFRECGAVALLSGDVATALRLLRTASGQPAGHGTVAAVDAVSAAWAERFARAVAPLRADGDASAHGSTVSAPLPQSARLLDELGLARATPASLMARWASATEGTAVLGAGPRGPVAVDLTAEGPHLLVEGPPGSGRTELLRAIAASLAAGGRPDRLGLLLVEGTGGERGEGLAALTELPHVAGHLVASDPVRMREFAQALGAELKRRAELLGGESFAEWHSRREVSDRLGGQRPASAAESRGDLDAAPSGTLRLRPAGARPQGEAPPPPLPRLVVLADDYDALVAPALGSPGRPAAGSVVRALEAVARDGERLGVHLIATSARPERTADTELTHGARLRVVLDPPTVSPGPEDPAPGRGRLGLPDGLVIPFQGGRVTGRIPRTATLRPTVVELEWERMGDPPARRPVRELGNGPTDLALLASALDRAARSVDAAPLPPLTPVRP